MPNPRLMLATGNAGKVREIRAILGDAGWDILTPAEAGYLEEGVGIILDHGAGRGDDRRRNPINSGR